MTHTTTKQIKSAYTQYKKSNLCALRDCYKDHSAAKENAMDYCKALRQKYDGFYGKIIGYNCMQFSYGFIGKINDRPAFFYITKDYDRYIYIDELED